MGFLFLLLFFVFCFFFCSKQKQHVSSGARLDLRSRFLFGKGVVDGGGGGAALYFVLGTRHQL